MKIAEALLEKKNLATRITELQNRYTAAAVIEEDTTPDESAEEILASLHDAFAQWEILTVQINSTNNAFMFVVGEKNMLMSMMQALAHRDSLKSQISHFNGIVTAIRQRNQQQRYYGEKGPKMVVAEGVNAKYFLKLVDDLSKELRVLDAAIQAANWAYDLVP